MDTPEPPWCRLAYRAFQLFSLCAFGHFFLFGNPSKRAQLFEMDFSDVVTDALVVWAVEFAMDLWHSSAHTQMFAMISPILAANALGRYLVGMTFALWYMQICLSDYRSAPTATGPAYGGYPHGKHPTEDKTAGEEVKEHPQDPQHASYEQLLQEIMVHIQRHTTTNMTEESNPEAKSPGNETHNHGSKNHDGRPTGSAPPPHRTGKGAPNEGSKLNFFHIPTLFPRYESIGRLKFSADPNESPKFVPRDTTSSIPDGRTAPGDNHHTAGGNTTAGTPHPATEATPEATPEEMALVTLQTVIDNLLPTEESFAREAIAFVYRLAAVMRRASPPRNDSLPGGASPPTSFADDFCFWHYIGTLGVSEGEIDGEGVEGGCAVAAAAVELARRVVTGGRKMAGQKRFVEEMVQSWIDSCHRAEDGGAGGDGDEAGEDTSPAQEKLEDAPDDGVGLASESSVSREEDGELDSVESTPAMDSLCWECERMMSEALEMVERLVTGEEGVVASVEEKEMMKRLIKGEAEWPAKLVKCEEHRIPPLQG